MKKKILIIQVRSSIGLNKKCKSILIGLGLRGIGNIVKRNNTSSLRGMLNKIYYIIKLVK